MFSSSALGPKYTSSVNAESQKLTGPSWSGEQAKYQVLASLKPEQKCKKKKKIIKIVINLAGQLSPGF